MTPRTFPVCRTRLRITWECAERAHRAYVEKWHSGQSLDTLATRGGFYADELDEFAPDWREHVVS